MSTYNLIKRRLVAKGSQCIKKVIFPITAFLVLYHVLTRQVDEKSVVNNLVVPGEALDPIFNRDPPKASTLHHLPAKLEKYKHIHTSNVEKVPKIETKRHSNGMKRDKFESRYYGTWENVPGRIQTNWSMAKANIPDSHKVKFKGHAITEDTVTLTLMSSEDKVLMAMNKKEIYRSLGQRGMHIVVINQYSGRVMAKRIFDTCEEGTEEDMVTFLDDIRDGRIVVLSVLDDASKGLTWKGRGRLKEMGAKYADVLNFRDMWAMVTRKGGLKMAETYSNVATQDTGYDWGGPLFFRTDFDLLETPDECKWERNERNSARRLFCLRYDGYGDLCHCEVPQFKDVFFNVDQNLHNSLSQNILFGQLGIAILATNRAHSLYRTIKSLFEAPGLNKNHLVIYVEDATREVEAVAKLFGVAIVKTGNHRNCTIKQKIRHKVQRVLRDLAGAKFAPDTVPTNGLPDNTVPTFTAANVLILEEDMIVAVDIFKYLYSIYPILQEDPTIHGISTFNYHGYRDVASEETSFYRTSDPQVFATLMPPRTIHKILAPKWPKLDERKEWWDGLRSHMQSGNGDLIHPEVPRVKHSSYDGYMIKGLAQKDLFEDHILTLTSNYEIGFSTVQRLKLNNYRQNVIDTITESEALNIDFCTIDLPYGMKKYIVFVQFDGHSETHINNLMKCLKTWSLFPIGGWKNVWQFHYHGHLLTIVGSPSSEFSHLKPFNVEIVTSPSNATKVDRYHSDI